MAFDQVNKNDDGQLPMTAEGAAVQLHRSLKQEQLELLILAYCWRDWEFWVKQGKAICRGTGADGTPEFLADFTHPSDNAIYHCVSLHNQGFSSPEAHEPLNSVTLQSWLMHFSRQGMLISEIEIEPTIQRFSMLEAYAQLQWKAETSLLVARWLQGTRTGRMLTTAARLTAQDMSLALGRIIADTTSAMDRKRMFTYAEALAESKETQVRRIPCGHSGLDRQTAGGLARKEPWLFIAAQGVGKTVAAVQIAGQTAIHQHEKTLLITTEEPAMRLVNRVLANRAVIPYSKLVNGIDLTRLNADEMSRFKKFDTEFRDRKNLLIYEWPKDRPATINEELPRILDEARRHMGDVSVVVFDWLGKALGISSRQDMAMTRLIYQRAGDDFAMLSDTENYAGVTFCQAAPKPKEGYDNLKVGAHNITECKTIGERFPVVIGMSGMRAGPDADDGSPNFHKEQQFYMSKSRNSEGSTTKYLREYNYMRIGEV